MKRRHAAAFLALAFGVTGAPVVAGPAAFRQKLHLQGITFEVSSPNTGSVNVLRITVGGRITRKVTIKKEIFGTVTQAEVADLNADGWPEIYIYVTSAGSGSYGSVEAYAVNRGKSVTPIALPDLMDDKTASRGFRGHDVFAVVEDTLARRFPLYSELDTNANPSGGTRQIHYRLVSGEAGWRLRMDSTMTSEY